MLHIVTTNICIYSAYVFFRREAAQMCGVQQSLFPEQQPHHAHAEAHRLQTLCLRSLREAVPAQGRPAPPQRVPTSRPAHPHLLHPAAVVVLNTLFPPNAQKETDLEDLFFFLGGRSLCRHSQRRIDLYVCRRRGAKTN